MTISLRYTNLVTRVLKLSNHNNLFKNLSNENLTQKQIEHVFSEYREILITKTNNRSVLASMNEFAYQARWLIYDMGGLANIDQDVINRELNRIPMGAIDYSNGIKELHKALNQIGA